MKSQTKTVRIEPSMANGLCAEDLIAVHSAQNVLKSMTSKGTASPEADDGLYFRYDVLQTVHHALDILLDWDREVKGGASQPS